MKANEELIRLKAEVKALKKELSTFKKTNTKPIKTVLVPPQFKSIFEKAEKNVGKYHQSLAIHPEKASIEISGQRYLLVRASALSIEFLEGIMSYYRDRGEKEALSIGKSILFDLAHLIGVEDASNFSTLMNLNNPDELLSAGPVHFAYTGWAQVKILEDSHPSPGPNFMLHYTHPFSFEADSWIAAGKQSEQPVCVMNSGYSSGWCEQSYGIKLTSVEITCRAKGDKECTFIMAPPDKIQSYLKKQPEVKKDKPEVPTFLKQKTINEQLSASLHEKELLLKEIHHRVKNNLQIISSLLNLQLHTIDDPKIQTKFRESINRISSMAELHNLLYRSKNFASISFTQYLPAIVHSLKFSYNPKVKVDLVFDIKMKKDELDIDKAIPCGLILNEIISNSFKYAFKGRKSGRITVCFSDHVKDSKHQYRLSVSDNGIGYKQPEDIEESKTLGLQLIHSLSKQLDAELTLNTKRGTHYQIDFS